MFWTFCWRWDITTSTQIGPKLIQSYSCSLISPKEGQWVDFCQIQIGFVQCECTSDHALSIENGLWQYTPKLPKLRVHLVHLSKAILILTLVEMSVCLINFDIFILTTYFDFYCWNGLFILISEYKTHPYFSMIHSNKFHFYNKKKRLWNYMF